VHSLIDRRPYSQVKDKSELAGRRVPSPVRKVAVIVVLE
jgi:hypothetical protein